MTDLLARVAAIAEREAAKAADKRAAMREQHPEFAAFVDSCRKAFGADAVHAVTLDVTRYGPAPLTPRRNQTSVPPMPPLLTLRQLREVGDIKVAAAVDSRYGERG